jgi:hypothetical protein
MTRYRVHILYEYDIGRQPHGSAHIRLLRPLLHPTTRKYLNVTAGLKYEKQKVDAVLIDRLWRPDISLRLAEELVNDIRLAGTRLIYSVDDNFLDLPAEREDWPTEDHLRVVKFFLCQADGVVVTTPALKERYPAV